jgi:hypothetical protein
MATEHQVVLVEVVQWEIPLEVEIHQEKEEVTAVRLN